jgi:hypothetical protein
MGQSDAQSQHGRGLWEASAVSCSSFLLMVGCVHSTP